MRRLLLAIWCRVFGHAPYRRRLHRVCRRCEAKLSGYCQHEWRHEWYEIHDTPNSAHMGNLICNKCGIGCFSTVAYQNEAYEPNGYCGGVVLVRGISTGINTHANQSALTSEPQAKD